MVIQKGDQYAIPVSIKMHGIPITPESCDDVIIQIGDKPKQASLGEIQYNENTQKWEYPMSREESLAYEPITLCQVGLRFGETIKNAPVRRIDVKESIIMVDWQ